MSAGAGAEENKNRKDNVAFPRLLVVRTQRSANRPGWFRWDSARRGGRRGGARLLTWSRILRMSTGSVTSPMTRSCPPQRTQSVMSNSKTRFKRCVLVRGAVGESMRSVEGSAAGALSDRDAVADRGGVQMVERV